MKTTYKTLLLSLTFILGLLLFTACKGSSESTEIAIAKITAYAQNGTPVPTVQDYLDAGVTGVTEANLAEINEIVSNLTPEEVDTVEEIQAVVSSTVGVATSIIHNGTTYGFVTSPHTGKVWLDRNLGASQVCTAYNDSSCYGDLYQWGRNFDGHQDRVSDKNSSLATDVNNTGSSFITTTRANRINDWVSASVDDDGSLRSANWSATDGSSVCPVGFRVPTFVELRKETFDEDVTNRATAFANFLKLPSSGYRRKDGKNKEEGLGGYVWPNAVSGSDSRAIYFENGSGGTSDDNRVIGESVRCIKD